MQMILPVLHVAGVLLCGLGVSMLAPALVDLHADNRDWQVFAVCAVATWTFGFFLWLSTRRPEAIRMTVRQAFLTTATLWITVSAFSALPFLGLGLSYGDAFFEAVSGFTTTGSTILVGLDGLPPGILLWRSLLQWIGGVGIIVTAIIILPFLRVGGMQLFHTESSDRSEKIVPRPAQLVGYIASVYVALSVACAIAYALAGMGVFDAVNHAMTTLSTGGYSTHDASFGHFDQPAIHWVAVAFMITGAFPFVAYIRMVKGDRGALLRDPQARALAVLLALISVALGLWLSRSLDVAPLEALRLTAFNVVSVVTTTGFANADYTGWGPPAIGLFFILTFIGGCTGSTSGAIKIYRFQILARVVLAHMRRLMRPDRVTTLRYGTRRVPDDVPTSVLAFIAVFMGTIGAFTLALSAMGLDLVTALSASATAICNVGPGLGDIVGPAGNFATLPDAAKWLLSFAMLLGRLELFTLLLLFDPEFWRR